jgi:hypothetical protein
LSVDAALSAKDERSKEVLVVVTRGREVNLDDNEKPPFRTADIRSWAGSMPWTEIASRHSDLSDFSGDYYEDFLSRDVAQLKEDRYEDVQSYEWRPLHLSYHMDN